MKSHFLKENDVVLSSRWQFLRSMAYDGERCAIYVGGGYTSQSNALDEWKETEIKSKTLIDVIENHNLNIQ